MEACREGHICRLYCSHVLRALAANLKPLGHAGGKRGGLVPMYRSCTNTRTTTLSLLLCPSSSVSPPLSLLRLHYTMWRTQEQKLF